MSKERLRERREKREKERERERKREKERERERRTTTTTTTTTTMKRFGVRGRTPKSGSARARRSTRPVMAQSAQVSSFPPQRERERERRERERRERERELKGERKRLGTSFSSYVFIFCLSFRFFPPKLSLTRNGSVLKRGDYQKVPTCWKGQTKVSKVVNKKEQAAVYQPAGLSHNCWSFPDPLNFLTRNSSLLSFSLSLFFL